MSPLKPCFRISDGSAFDIHYMTLALMCLESTCREKERIAFFGGFFSSPACSEKPKGQKEGTRIRNDRSTFRGHNVNTNVIMEV